jgi:hypothetical protein
MTSVTKVDGTSSISKDDGTSASTATTTTTASTATIYDYTYAGASQNEVLSQTTPNGTYSITYGRTDAHGQPIIEQYKKDNATAYVEHDPVTGEALLLRTSTGMQSLYVYDGTGNPTALLTSGAYTAFAYDYDPYGVRATTTDSGGNGTTQNPYTFKAGIQDRLTGWVKFGARWPTGSAWSGRQGERDGRQLRGVRDVREARWFRVPERGNRRGGDRRVRGRCGRGRRRRDRAGSEGR